MEPAGPPEPLPSWWELHTVADAIGAYGWTVRGLISGEVDPKTGNSIVVALGGFVHAVKEGDLERRLGEMEEAMGLQKDRK